MFIGQSHDEVYGCLKGGSGNSGGKRLAISMVEEAWLSEKKEVYLNESTQASYWRFRENGVIKEPMEYAVEVTKEVNVILRTNPLYGAEEINGDNYILSSTEKENASSDPICTFTISYKRNKAQAEANSGLDSSIPFPPGFTPEREFQHVDAQEVQGMENSLSKRRSEGLSSRVLEDAQPLNEHVSHEHLSDHRPILLREVVTDYGPSPFRVYHSWFSLQGFDQMVSETWNNIDLDDNNKMVRFKKKLQILKKEIRSWVNDCKKNQSGRLVDLRSKLCHIDKVIDQGGVNDDILLTRLDLLKKLHDIKSSDARDYMQKAKIQWAIEGDENSNFFHGIINRKRANLAIKGVMVDGEWVDDPCRVKEEFRLHFANRFRAPAANKCKLNYTFPNRLSSDQLDMLESPISRDEVRNAVWGCRDCLEGFVLCFELLVIGSKWCSWDWGCSTLGHGFVLLNDVQRRIPISLAIEAGIFKGIKIGSSLNISHLFYADDAVFIGEWSIANLSGITHILHCFSLLSGLSINLKKSHLLGVGIRSEDVNAAALYFDRGVDLISHCHIRVGNGLRTQFWNEVWIGDTQLRVMFPRIYALEINKDCTVADKLQFSVTSSLRRSARGGVWDLNGEGFFRVKDVRILLDECFLPKAPTATRWVKYVPIKINVFAGRKIPRTCSSVADWLRISSGSYAAGGIYHGRPLVHMLIGLIGSIPSD
ncbi:hypothetical protein Tco_0157011 [Tanacetum coccineum]